MKFTQKSVTASTEFLANDHFVTKAYDCTALTALATDGIIKAGTVIPANNATAEGILLNDVNLNENPNGAIVLHGFVMASKLPVAVDDTAKTALKQIVFFA